jgi:SIR2-like domain
MKDELVEILKSRPAGPFLFVGSGFSRRYLGLEDWRGLLSRFCVAGKPFEYYLASANGDYPAVASLLAADFNEHWWYADEFKASVEQNKDKVTNVTSALRIEISRHLRGMDQATAKASAYADEVALLASLNVDGIITTNWDGFLEEVFPDYTVYIGQEQLLFSNPQQIGEIYKIHGCASAPSSMVLTSDDYQAFNDRNAYLAAKLITLFVEHPIVFMGYSLADKNIANLLRAIANCIGSDNIEKLRRNLIFVQRLHGDDKPGMSDTYIAIDGVQIPLILVKTDDFSMIYEALGTTTRKIPARVLRYCKEQLYELVKSTEPEKKLCVVDIDEIDRKEDVEFLVGVGVASSDPASIGGVGYASLEAEDLIHDLLHNDRGYEAQQVLDVVVKKAGRNSKNVPVFKYLRAAGINSLDDYRVSGLQLDKWVLRDYKDFKLKTYSRSFFLHSRHKSTDEIIADCTAETAAAHIPFMMTEKIDRESVRRFLIENEHKLSTKAAYASYFRKLASLYDKLVFGW